MFFVVLILFGSAGVAYSTIQAGTMPMPASPAAYILTLPDVPAGF
jgi:hypothetical protein